MDNKEFVWTEEVVKEFSEYLIVRRSYDLKDINQHVSDFKKLKKRIVVVVEATMDGRPESVAYMGDGIPTERYSQIKGAIEMVLNGDRDRTFAIFRGASWTTTNHEPLFTLKQLEKREEDAFYAAKEPYSKTAMGGQELIKKYPEFKDYLKEKYNL